MLNAVVYENSIQILLYVLHKPVLCLLSFCFLGEELESNELRSRGCALPWQAGKAVVLTRSLQPFPAWRHLWLCITPVIELTLLHVIPLMCYCDQEKMNSPFCVHKQIWWQPAAVLLRLIHVELLLRTPGSTWACPGMYLAHVCSHWPWHLLIRCNDFHIDPGLKGRTFSQGWAAYNSVTYQPMMLILNYVGRMGQGGKRIL